MCYMNSKWQSFNAYCLPLFTFNAYLFVNKSNYHLVSDIKVIKKQQVHMREHINEVISSARINYINKRFIV